METGPNELPTRYRGLREIGRGGAAAVFLAYDTRAQKAVAIKVLHRRYQGNAEILKRFHREAQAMIALKHPNLVKIYDFVITGSGTTYMVMEYIHGWSLKHTLKLPATVREKIALPVIYHVAEALAHCHAKGVLHRDLKPQNVLISSTGAVKLSDFGIAKSMGATEDLTRTGHFVGTPLYSSPEQIAGERDLDARSDIYSLGCLLYELLVGLPPFHQADLEVLLDAISYGDYQALRTACPKLNPRVHKLNERMMALQKEKRFSSMTEVTQEILGILKVNASEDVAKLFRSSINAFGAPSNPEPPEKHAEKVVELPLATSARDSKPRLKENLPKENLKEKRSQLPAPIVRASSGSTAPEAPGHFRWITTLFLFVGVGLLLWFVYHQSVKTPALAPPETAAPLPTLIPPMSDQELLKKTLQPLLSQNPVLTPPWIPPVAPSPQPYFPEFEVSTPQAISVAPQTRQPPIPPSPDPVLPEAPPRPQTVATHYGTLSLSLDTPASVSVNGKDIGTEPRAEYKAVPVFSRTAEIKISVPGLEGHVARTVKLLRGKETHLEFLLAHEHFGYIQIKAPSGVRVYVDGRFKGDQGQFKPLALWKGMHDVQFLVPGYAPKTKKIKVSPGQTTTVAEL